MYDFCLWSSITAIYLPFFTLLHVLHRYFDGILWVKTVQSTFYSMDSFLFADRSSMLNRAGLLRRLFSDLRICIRANGNKSIDLCVVHLLYILCIVFSRIVWCFSPPYRHLQQRRKSGIEEIFGYSRVTSHQTCEMLAYYHLNFPK